MKEHTVEVTPAELEVAMRVWLRRVPKSVQGRYERWLKLCEAKRQSREDMVDLPAEFAAAACAAMVRAGWKVVRRPNTEVRDLTKAPC